MVATPQERVDELKTELKIAKMRLTVATAAYKKLAGICRQYLTITSDLEAALISIANLHDRLVKEIEKE